MWLSHADNVLSDPFGELSNDQPYAEALISVMGNAVSLSRTVADGVERAFSATADAETTVIPTVADADPDLSHAPTTRTDRLHAH